jgi:DNA-binding GntR family transcriptional regulator
MSAATESQDRSMADRSYDRLLAMVLDLRLRPGERINESDMSRKLGVSRTPLREALNRLASEGLLETRATKGFFCRHIVPSEVFQLFQLRAAIEVAAVKLAVHHATDKELDAIDRFLEATRDSAEAPVKTLIGYDEEFHESMVRLSRNTEMERALHTVNRKIWSVRWIDLDRRGRSTTQQEHRMIVAAVRDRDPALAADIVEAHINRRQEEIETVIRDLYGRLYVDGELISLAG